MALFEAVTLGMFGGYTEAADKFIEVVHRNALKTREEVFRKTTEKTGRRLTNRELLSMDIMASILIDDIPPYVEPDFKRRLCRYGIYLNRKRRRFPNIRPRRR